MRLVGAVEIGRQDRLDVVLGEDKVVERVEAGLVEARERARERERAEDEREAAK